MKLGLVDGPFQWPHQVAIALATIPLTILWLVDSLWLGRRQERMAAEQAAAGVAPAR